MRWFRDWHNGHWFVAGVMGPILIACVLAAVLVLAQGCAHPCIPCIDDPWTKQRAM